MTSIELKPNGKFPWEDQPMKVATWTATSTFQECEHNHWDSDRIVIKRFGIEICRELVIYCFDCREFLNGKAARRIYDH